MNQHDEVTSLFCRRVLLLVLLVGPLTCLAQRDILIADFEGADYGPWKVQGEAFGPGPARGTLPNQMPVSGFLGQGLVNSFFKGDGTTGTLTSPPFKIERRFINFLIGGGGYAGETCMNLLVEGKAVRAATGPNTQSGGSEALDWETWDVRPFAGREAVLQIVDQRTGGWGHISIDHITQSDERQAVEVVADRLYRETWRPQFHFTAQKNWLNDPNGLVFYKGEYHLFFQHNPEGINWGNMTWGHAVSKDLVHWTQRAHAIERDHLGTIFSGSAVVDWHNTAGFQKGKEKTLVAIYTAAGGTSPESKGQKFTQCMAYSRDRGRTWTKYEKNPILGHLVAENRDPKVVWHEPTQKWIMALFKNGNDFALFSSPDLKSWTHRQDLTMRECGECPDFFEMPVEGDRQNTKWVFTAANGRYLIGEFDGQKFTIESGPHVADRGGNYYAVQTYSDILPADGRRIQVAWMNGGRYPRMPFNQQMSFPCELKLRSFPEGFRLCRTPVREIERLHTKTHSWKNELLKPGENLLAGITGELFDIRAEIEPGQATEFGISCRGEPVRYNVKERELSCLGRSADLAPVDHRIQLQILLDRTSLEVFANDGRVSMTTCFLPQLKNKSLEIFAVGAPVKVVSLNVHEIRSAWPATPRSLTQSRPSRAAAAPTVRRGSTPAQTRTLSSPLTDKTLVTWVQVANTTQRGGSALTLQNEAEEFDAIVFGEHSPGKWMAGSDFFRRTQKDQSASPMETATPEALVQMAIVYRGQDVSLFRNGQLYARYPIEKAHTFGEDSIVVIGLRHLAAGDRACLVGAIEDARIYNGALDAKTIAALQPNAPSDPAPLAWWDFEGNQPLDRMKTFPQGQLFGSARIEKGKLHLPGNGSYLVAGGEAPRTRATEDWPQWHVTALPEEGVGLPYDANGCIYWKGRYHLMYIYQDPKRPHGGHCWGHASSPDLVNWTFHPPSVVPEPSDPDVGIFSGNAFVNKEGVPMLCWFGINAGVCVATAQDDELIRWTKHPKNPIVPIPKPGQPGHGVYTVWDPFLWLEGDTYICLLGGNKLPNGKDTLYACKSSDLVNWTPLHPFYEHADLTWTTTEGEDCSCPDFFRLGGRHVLMCISHKVGARCYLGRFDAAQVKFFPEQHVRMNWPGGTFFAPESLLDSKGRRIFWAWVTDPRKMTTQRATGSGFQSMPRVLSLAEDGTIRISPAEELQQLRRNHRRLKAASLGANHEVALEAARGDCLELAIEIDPKDATEVGLKVRCSPDGLEETAIYYQASTKKLVLDMSRSTLRKDVKYSAGPLDGYGSHHDPRSAVEAPFELRPGETLKLRVFLDKPLLEVFANERQCITQQIYPESKDALLVKAWAKGGPARLRGGDVWALAPARFINEKAKQAEH